MGTRTTFRSAAVAGLFAFALVASGCSQSSDPETWEAADEIGKVEENFIRACTEGDDGNSDADALADYCQCSYDGLRQEYDDDFEGFLNVNRDLGNEPASIPPNVRAIFDGCAADHLGS